MADTGTRISLKNILFLTDFSGPSQTALPFAIAIAREFGATIHALHILMPEPYVYTASPELMLAGEAQESRAHAEMQRVDAELTGVPHEAAVVRRAAVWPGVEQAITHHDAELIVLGTHGRTGAARLLLGSVAEEVFRRSPVPVLTIGPRVRRGIHNAARFHHVLFATDFTPESVAAARHAVSLAQEHQARLILLHVLPDVGSDVRHSLRQPSVADCMHQLYSLVPKDAERWCRPEAVVEYGEPAARIIEAAKERQADLIAIGVRSAAKHLGAATHLERTTAHKIVAHAPCPALTVRI